MMDQQRVDQHPLPRGQAVIAHGLPGAGEASPLHQQPLGHEQVNAPGQFFSSSPTATAVAAASASWGVTGTTLPVP